MYEYFFPRSFRMTAHASNAKILITLNYETLFSVPSRVCTAVVIPAQAGIQVSSG